MLIIPAIDLKDGKAVRLRQGKAEDATVYFDNPVEAALLWRDQGAELLHVVDLDGAFQGNVKNRDSLKNIITASGLRVEFGGGIRDMDTVDRLLSLGVDRFILGTAAINDQDFLKTALGKLGERIIISVDVKNGFVATHGWRSVSERTPHEFISDLIEKGARRFVYTDISRDGMLQGPNLGEAVKLFSHFSASFIVSGGISSLDDIKRIIRAKIANVEGVIAGKALYENKFSLSEAVHLVKNPDDLLK